MSAPRTDLPGWAVVGQRNADLLVADLRAIAAAPTAHDALGHAVDALDWALTRADRGELSPVQLRAVLDDIRRAATTAYDRQNRPAPTNPAAEVERLARRIALLDAAGVAMAHGADDDLVAELEAL